MGELGDAGAAFMQAPDVRRSEPLMHLAMPLPGDDLDGGPRRGLRARYPCASMMTRGTPSASMIFFAFAEVQQMSDAALTAAEALT